MIPNLNAKQMKHRALILFAALSASACRSGPPPRPSLAGGEFVSTEQNYKVLSIPVAQRLEIGTLVDVRNSRILPMSIRGHLPDKLFRIGRGKAANLRLVANRTVNGGINALLQSNFHLYSSLFAVDSSTLIIRNARAESFTDVSPIYDFMLSREYPAMSPSLRGELEREGVEIVTEIIYSSSQSATSEQIKSASGGLTASSNLDLNAGITQRNTLETSSSDELPIMFRTEKTGAPKIGCFETPPDVEFDQQTSTVFELKNHCPQTISWRINLGLTRRLKALPSGTSIAPGAIETVTLIRESCAVMQTMVALTLDAEETPHVIPVSQLQKCTMVAATRPPAPDAKVAKAAVDYALAKASLSKADFSTAYEHAKAAGKTIALRDDPEFQMWLNDAKAVAREEAALTPQEKGALSHFGQAVTAYEVSGQRTGESPLLSGEDAAKLKTTPTVTNAAVKMAGLLLDRPSDTASNFNSLIETLTIVKPRRKE